MPPFDLEKLKEIFKLKIIKLTEDIDKEIRKHDIGDDYILQDVYDYIIRLNQKKILNQLYNHIKNNFDVLYNTNSMDLQFIDDNVAKQIVDIHKQVNDKLDIVYTKVGHKSFLRYYSDELIIPTVDACISNYLNDKDYKNKIDTYEEFYVFKNEVMGIVNTILYNYFSFIELMRYSLVELRKILFVHSSKINYNRITYCLEEEELDVAIENLLKLDNPVTNSLATVYYRYNTLLTQIKILKPLIDNILFDIDNKNNYPHTLLNLFAFLSTLLQYQCIYDVLLNSLQTIKNTYDSLPKPEVSRTERRKIDELINEIKNFDITFLRSNYQDFTNKALQLSIFIKNHIFNKVDEFML